MTCPLAAKSEVYEEKEENYKNLLALQIVNKEKNTTEEGKMSEEL